VSELLLVPVWAAFVMVVALSATSKLGGWSKLAERFPARSEFKGPWKSFQYASVNWAGYKGCAWIGTTDDAFYMKTGPGPLFSLAHPTMQIPWSELEFIQTCRWFGRSFVKLSPRVLPDIVLTLPESALGDHWKNLSHRLAR
jgi:hypothetical protein